jgi:pyruvate formate-lyase/glycerol dehydratase family glycyl radical enzyme
MEKTTVETSQKQRNFSGPASKTKKESRTKILKEKILNAPYEICVERARYYTQSYRETNGEHPAIRAAKGFANTINKMSVYILDEELIVGNRSGKLVATVIPVERGEINLVLEMELDRLQKRPDRPFHISSAEKKELLKDILPYWNGKTIRDRKKELWKENNLFFPMKLDAKTGLERLKAFGVKALYQQAAQSGGNVKLMARAGEEIPINNPGLVMNVFDVQGHLVIGHKNIIQEGFSGAKERAQKKLDGPKLDDNQRAFLESVIICCDSARQYADRFSKLAGEMAETGVDAQRKKELLEISQICERVPWERPENFREAIQFVWFTQVLSLLSHGVVSVFALGRMDQYLWPYLEKDLTDDKISEDEVLTLLEELIIKLSYNLLVLPPYGKDTGSELGADNMAVTIGGVGRDGEDATNPLTYLFIRATENIRHMTNSISFRVNEKSPDEYVKQCMAVHRKSNGPAIFNDEAIVPALANSGYSIEDARNYAIIGCVEPTSDGNTFGCTSGNDISLVGALEMALHDGKLIMTGRKIGARTGDPANFITFDDFFNAYKKQVSTCVDIIVKGTNLKDQAYAERLPCPYVSLTLKGCIENASDMTTGGAQYNFNSISGRGLATAVDSIAAIKKFVYEENSISMKDLVSALDTNFKGKEKLRQKLLTRAPKFGNNDDYVDEIAKEVADFFCKEVMKHKTNRGGIFRPSFFSYGMHVFEGKMLCATPNGRKSGEAISNSLSPTNNCEKKGPIAALQSVAKLDHTLIPNGSSTNVKMMPSMIANDSGLDKVSAMVRSYFKQGGQQIQFNVIDNKELKKAQKDPDSYKDLVVRVSGYSAYFVDLGKSLQNDIINRHSFDGV